MGAETAVETWFSNFWRNSRKSIAVEPEKPIVGILAFEISRLMSKVVNIWQCLCDRNIVKLREDIVNSLGIQKLVSEDDDYLMDLALVEIIDTLGSSAKVVTSLGKKCADPMYQNLEQAFSDPIEIDINCRGWEYRPKKMERKVKKMERFVACTQQLYQELEVLAELEQNLRRMQAGADLGQVKVLEYQQKVVCQRQDVKNLRDMSPWVRHYDYIVRLLVRSIFTIIKRIKQVYGLDHANENASIHSDGLIRSNSISSILQLSDVQLENNLMKLSGPFGRSLSNLGLTGEKNKSKKSHARTPSSILCGKQPQIRTRKFAPVGPFKGCMTSGRDSPVVQSYMPSTSGLFKLNSISHKDMDEKKYTDAIPTLKGIIISTPVSFFSFKRHLLTAPPSTLGYAALALHYANIIILIEKLASAPHLISLDARDDLYSMLPTSIRSRLRAKLKIFSKSLALSEYDAALAAEWSMAVARILEWLSPLAHNMIRWHSERNFEKQPMIFGTNVLLVQTLYFADQVKTEAAITELLMGLNYLSRFDREVNEKQLRRSSCSRAFNDCVFPRMESVTT